MSEAIHKTFTMLGMGLCQAVQKNSGSPRHHDLIDSQGRVVGDAFLDYGPNPVFHYILFAGTESPVATQPKAGGHTTFSAWYHQEYRTAPAGSTTGKITLSLDTLTPEH